MDGSVTDALEADALTYENQYIDIYSASWGPTDDGKTMEGPHKVCKQALKTGTEKVSTPAIPPGRGEPMLGKKLVSNFVEEGVS